MTKGDRIRQLRERIGKSQTAFADMINVSKQTLYKYENDIITNIPSDKIEAIAAACNSTPSYIMGWADKSAYKTVMIPLLASVSCGSGCLADDNIEGYVDLPENVAKTGEFFALTVKGDSMEPDIHDGDVVIVKKQPDAESGEIIVARINGDEGVCKKLRKYEDGTVALVSNNPSYPPKYFSSSEVAEKPVAVVGKVVELRRHF